MLISGWDKWQTYRKDRGTPPWIKVYRNLFSNEEWASLSDAEKGQLVSLWILAADKHGFIPDNPKVLQKMCMLDSPPNVNKFIDLGFMATDCQPSGDHAVTINGDLDAPETETETETETDFSPDSDEIRLSNLLFNSILKRNPKHKKPNFQTWAAHIDKIIRINGRDPQEIANVIGWCQGDSFWQNNILSTKKLRDQFDQLILKMSEQETGGQVISGNHPHFKKIQLLSKIISRKATAKEESDYSKNYNDLSYDAMRQRASDEKERLMRES